MKMLVYITYAPLNLLCIVLSVLETILVVLPIISRFLLLNQNVVVLPHKNTSSVERISCESDSKEVK